MGGGGPPSREVLPAVDALLIFAGLVEVEIQKCDGRRFTVSEERRRDPPGMETDARSRQGIGGRRSPLAGGASSC